MTQPSKFPFQPGPYSIELGFLSFVPILNKIQITLYLVIDFLSGPDHRWISFSAREVCESLNISRSNASQAIRKLVISGLLQRDDRGARRQHRYRTCPNIPVLLDSWVTRLDRLDRKVSSGPKTVPDVFLSGPKTVPDKENGSGPKIGPSELQTDSFSAAHPYITRKLNTTSSISSSKGAPEAPSDDDDFPGKLAQKFGDAGKPVPTSRQSRSVAKSIDPARRQDFLEFLSPAKLEKINHPGALPALVEEFHAQKASTPAGCPYCGCTRVSRYGTCAACSKTPELARQAAAERNRQK